MTTPKPWQPPVIDAMAQALDAGKSFGDFSDPGIGKTYSTCFASVKARVRLGVTCPMSVIPSWIEAASRTGARLSFVGNIEALKAERKHLQRRGAHQWEWCLEPDVRLVVDEVHRFKHSNTQNGKILRFAPRPTIMLSGTPFGGPHEARAIGHQLGLFHWDDFEQWAGQHGCKYGPMGGLEFVGLVRVPKGWTGSKREWADMCERERRAILDRIHRQIHHTGRGVRIRKSELGDLFPHITRETVLLPTSEGEAIDAAYLEELENLRSEAPNGGVEFLRSLQISEFSMVPHLIEMGQDLLASGQSVLFFVNFRDTFNRLSEEFEGCARIYGGQDEEGVPREEERLRFQRDQSRVLVAMIQAGGVALSAHDLNGNFPRTSIIVPGVSAEQVIQADGRDHRAGGLTPVQHKFCYSDCAFDRARRNKLETKIENIELLLDGDLMPV
jgi:hypothetical protein